MDGLGLPGLPGMSGIHGLPGSALNGFPNVIQQMQQMPQALTVADFCEEADDYEDGNEVPDIQMVTKKNNILPLWGNQNTMNLNALVLENVRESYYYKNHLIEIDNFQQLQDEIFYKVKHMEPWEKGTRKVQGMTGMCGGVRGVGAGGVVSSAYCLLYRLFNIKLTRRHVITMINSSVSPYIRGLGFMYIRYTQPPADLWAWFEPYLDDEEEVDPKSGTGDPMTFAQIVKLMLTKLDWYGTLFPRIPVPIQKEIDEKFAEKKRDLLQHAREREERKRGYERPEAKIDRLREETVEKKSKLSRCGHHLRHHHCRKHRKKCPAKAKE
ncbi:unnamed protein product [Auanema sp. JU1783]|nr:unnamed protein product [Auanema sp. JU1783]